MSEQKLRTDTPDSGWRPWLTIGGIAALVAAIVFRRWLGAEFEMLRSFGVIRFEPVPAALAIGDWFALLQTNRFVGLVLLNAFDLANYALVALMAFGLYAALRRFARGAMLFALAAFLTGVAVYFASNQAFALLSLSDQYAAAASAETRAAILAAGQALLTVNTFNAGGGGTVLAFFLVNLAGLVAALVMRKSGLFGKVAPWLGIIANAFGLSVIVPLAVGSPLMAIPMSASAPFLLVYYILFGVRLIRMGREG